MALEAHIPGKYLPLGESPAAQVEAAVLATVEGTSLLLLVIGALSFVRPSTSFDAVVAAAPFAAAAAAPAAVAAAPFA